MARRATRDIDRRLEAARLAGVAALCILAQFAVAMPHGYFGAADESTPFGRAYAAVVAAAAAIGVLAHARAAAWATALGIVFYALNLAVFLPALDSDPIRAAALVLWLGLAVARQLFPIELPIGKRRRGQAVPDALATWRDRWAPAVTQLVIVALAATVTVVGFGQSALRPAQLVCLGLHASTLALIGPYLVLLFRSGARAAALVPIPAVAALALWGQPGAAFLLLCAAQLLVLATVWARDATTGDLLEAFYAHPALAIVLTFVLQVAIGTLLLSFPAASADGRGVAAIDAFFTSTSATCVTGLIVLDTPAAFSTFGHVVLLFLIQVGGLNIMVLSTFAAVALGRGLGLRGELALGQVLDLGQHRQAYEITRFIVVATLVIEGVGAALLAGAYLARGESPLAAAWLGGFHSISAFCNAGFSLHTDNLVSFQRHPFVLGVVGALITLGGLGFTVLAAGWDRLRGRQAGPAPLQVKIVLVTSAALTFGVAAWYLVAEWSHSLAPLEPAHKVTNALFQSVSLRTAGFNSVDLAACARASIPILCLVMFVGASPGSTGGGIKTTTLATVLGTLASAVRGGAPIVMGGRTIPPSLAYRGAAVIVAAAGLGMAGVYLLTLTQRSPFEWLLFEVASALGTVGLTLGATFQLDGTGKLIVALLMFAGRIGPLTLFLLLSRPVEGRLGYPEAKLMIG